MIDFNNYKSRSKFKEVGSKLYGGRAQSASSQAYEMAKARSTLPIDELDGTNLDSPKSHN